MNPVDEGHIPIEQKIFTDSWKVLKAYYGINDSGSREDWQKLLTEIDRICEYGKDNPPLRRLANAVALGVMTYLCEHEISSF